MRTILVHAEHLLRVGRSGGHAPGESVPRRWLPALIVVFAMLYGGMMGTFQFHWPDRILQIAYSAAKVPLLLLATSGVCLPGFFVLNTILGLRDDFRQALGAVLAGQAGLSIVLASLSPLTVFFYLSSDNYRAALLFNLAAFALATLAGQLVILRHYRPLLARHRQHRITLAAWLILYAFVGVQMAWMLRPFIGAPWMPVTFFREEPFTNAYVVVAELFFG